MDDQLKPGVDLLGLSPQWGLAFPMIQHVFHERGYGCIVTSANDGKHSVNSLHYAGKALDFRTKHVQVMDKTAIRDAVIKALGTQWDVVLESVGLDQEHLHVEWDPKEPITVPI